MKDFGFDRTMNIASAIILGIATVCVHGAAAADEAPPLAPYDTAATLPAGEVTVGIFAPLRWGISDRIELEIAPLVSILAPSPMLRVRHVERDGWTVTGEYGLSYPSLLFGLSRGFLFPSGDSGGDVPQVLVPHLAFIASNEVAPDHVVSVRGSLAFGLPLTRGDVLPLDGFIAPLEVLVAPMLRQYHGRFAVSWDGALSEVFRARSTLAIHRIGEQPAGYAQSSPWLVSWHAAVDMRVGRLSRLSLGVMWWNFDNFRTTLRDRADGTVYRERVRSNEFWPTFDWVYHF
jgi:hypothetical protein